ncbi:unnamed protein product [Peniophora sp. CBMAI 1063]|nr:unnamed protein product [Peniophora sp. CBMAI 1063]
MPKIEDITPPLKTAEPYAKLPLLLLDPAADRKIVIPRLESYQDMIMLVKRKLDGLANASSKSVVLKSTSVPGLEGEKVEISEEAWPDIAAHVKSIEVEATKRVRSDTVGKAKYQNGAVFSSDAAPPANVPRSSTAISTFSTPAAASSSSKKRPKTATSTAVHASASKPKTLAPSQPAAGPSRPRNSEPPKIRAVDASVDEVEPRSFAAPSVLGFGQTSLSPPVVAEKRAPIVSGSKSTPGSRTSTQSSATHPAIATLPSPIVVLDSDDEEDWGGYDDPEPDIPLSTLVDVKPSPHTTTQSRHVLSVPSASKVPVSGAVYVFTRDDLKTCKAPPNFVAHEVFKGKQKMSDCLDMQVPNGAFYTAKCHACQKRVLPCQKIGRSSGGTGRNSAHTAAQPYQLAPLLLLDGDRKIVMPRLTDYKAMLTLVKKKIPDISDCGIEDLVCKSTSVPGLEGEKVEIGEESWEGLVPRLKTFEVEGDIILVVGDGKNIGTAARPCKASGPSRPHKPTHKATENTGRITYALPEVATLPFDKMVAIHAGSAKDLSLKSTHITCDERFKPIIRPRTLPSHRNVTVKIAVFGYARTQSFSLDWQEAFEAEINGRMTLGELKAKLVLVGTSNTRKNGASTTYNEVLGNSFKSPLTLTFNDSLGNDWWKDAPEDDSRVLASFLHLPESPPSYYYLRIHCLSTYDG